MPWCLPVLSIQGQLSLINPVQIPQCQWQRLHLDANACGLLPCRLLTGQLAARKGWVTTLACSSKRWLGWRSGLQHCLGTAVAAAAHRLGWWWTGLQQGRWPELVECPAAVQMALQECAGLQWRDQLGWWSGLHQEKVDWTGGEACSSPSVVDQ